MKSEVLIKTGPHWHHTALLLQVTLLLRQSNVLFEALDFRGAGEGCDRELRILLSNDAPQFPVLLGLLDEIPSLSVSTREFAAESGLPENKRS